jgi:hypothetical protein
VSVDNLVDQIRQHIADYKYVPTAIVDELPGEGKNAPHATVNLWNTFATGTPHEEFLTKNMPLVSGGKVVLKGGRWSYDFAGQYPDDYQDVAGHSGKREFLVDYYRGILIVPSGATPVVSGEKVLMNYSWWEDREYRFSDSETKNWVLDGDTYLRERITLPYTIEGRGDALSFSPLVPSGIWFSLLALSTSYFMRRRLQEEGIQDGIFVKDGDTSFDTTKTLVHRGRQLDQVKKDLESIIMDIKMGELAGAGIKIDTYSTKDWALPSAYDMETNVPQWPLFGGEV